MTTTQPKAPMTSFQKTIIGLLIALVLIVATAIIVFLVVTRNQAIEDKKAECELLYSPTSADYWYCIGQAEK